MKLNRDMETEEILRQYMLSLLRSRLALDRLLRSVARVAERDVGVALALSGRPEVLASLAQSVAGAEGVWVSQMLRRRSKVKHQQPGKPYICSNAGICLGPHVGRKPKSGIKRCFRRHSKT